MFRSLLIIIALLFASVYAQNSDLSKSFNAKCEAKNSSDCTYSLVLTSISDNSGYETYVTIIVDKNITLFSPYSIANSSDSEIINVNLTNNQHVLIYFNPFQGTNIQNIDFSLFNKADGKGVALMTSSTRQIMVNNSCDSDSCQFGIFGYSPQEQWPDNLSAVVTVNGQIKATVITADITYTFTVSNGDKIMFYLVTEPKNAPIPDGLSVYIDYRDDRFFQWYSNAYFFPIAFDSNCSEIFPQSPFGGLLSLITREQILIFLNSIKSQSKRWYSKNRR